MINLPHDEFYYLATPYSKYEGGIEKAFVDACKVAAAMVKDGFWVYSPIAHTHPIAVHGGIDPLDHSIWLPFDEPMMKACSALLIALLPGWQHSKGVAYEMDWFDRHEKPIYNLRINPFWLD